MLKPLTLKDTVYACIHWRGFPPPSAYFEEPVEEMWKNGALDQGTYQRHQIWEKACGKKEMEEGCLNCPHVRRLEIRPHRTPMLVTLDGKISTPTVDIPTYASRGTPSQAPYNRAKPEKAASRTHAKKGE